MQRWVTRRATMMHDRPPGAHRRLPHQRPGARPPYNGATAYRPDFDAWLAGKAEAAGAALVTLDDRARACCGTRSGRIAGVRTDRPDGDLTAHGRDRLRRRQLVPGQGGGAATRTPSPSNYTLGVKEVLALPREVIDEALRAVRPTRAPTSRSSAAPSGIPGGGFLYTNLDTIVGRAWSLSVCRAGRGQGAARGAHRRAQGATRSIAPLRRGRRAEGVLRPPHPRGRLRRHAASWSVDGMLVAGDAAAMCLAAGHLAGGRQLRHRLRRRPPARPPSTRARALATPRPRAWPATGAGWRRASCWPTTSKLRDAPHLVLADRVQRQLPGAGLRRRRADVHRHQPAAQEGCPQGVPAGAQAGGPEVLGVGQGRLGRPQDLRLSRSWPPPAPTRAAGPGRARCSRSRPPRWCCSARGPLLSLTESGAEPRCRGAWADLRLTSPSDIGTIRLDGSQVGNADTIVRTTMATGRTRQAATIALATAMQESALLNLDHGDEAGPDSRGLFQQRLQFYGDVDVMDPASATRAFLDRLDTRRRAGRRCHRPRPSSRCSGRRTPRCTPAGSGPPRAGSTPSGPTPRRAPPPAPDPRRTSAQLPPCDHPAPSGAALEVSGARGATWSGGRPRAARSGRRRGRRPARAGGPARRAPGGGRRGAPRPRARRPRPGRPPGPRPSPTRHGAVEGHDRAGVDPLEQPVEPDDLEPVGVVDASPPRRAPRRWRPAAGTGRPRPSGSTPISRATPSSIEVAVPEGAVLLGERHQLAAGADPGAHGGRR